MAKKITVREFIWACHSYCNTACLETIFCGEAVLFPVLRGSVACNRRLRTSETISRDAGQAHTMRLYATVLLLFVIGSSGASLNPVYSRRQIRQYPSGTESTPASPAMPPPPSTPIPAYVSLPLPSANLAYLRPSAPQSPPSSPPISTRDPDSPPPVSPTPLLASDLAPPRPPSPARVSSRSASPTSSTSPATLTPITAANNTFTPPPALTVSRATASVGGSQFMSPDPFLATDFVPSNVIPGPLTLALNWLCDQVSAIISLPGQLLNTLFSVIG
eukprot:jgi/Botrbrau1/21645/Bobra.43_1s0047.1